MLLNLIHIKEKFRLYQKAFVFILKFECEKLKSFNDGHL